MKKCLQASKSSIIIIIRTQKVYQGQVSTTLMEMLRNQWDQAGHHTQAMDLDLLKLRWLPSVSWEWTVIGVHIQEQSLHEVVFYKAGVSIEVGRISDEVENTGPEKFLEFDIFISSSEEWLNCFTSGSTHSASCISGISHKVDLRV